MPGVDDRIFTTARQRYLLSDKGIIKQDRLIRLIQEDGALTERVRMSMYLLFMLRDPRCRSFICNNLVRAGNRWSDEPLQLKNASYPEFPGASSSKAYTNLRGFLFQVGLVDEDFRLLPFPALESWFSDAIEVAAQHINDPAVRQEFLKAPQAVLARDGALGLLNVELDAIISVRPSLPSEETADLLPAYDEILGKQTFDASEFKTWNRSAPVPRADLTRDAVLTNPALLERANTQHFHLEKAMAAICTDSGFEVKATSYVDLLATRGETNLLFEMKSCTRHSLRQQIRRGISQLFEYGFLYRTSLNRPLLCLVVEQRPDGKLKWMVEYVESLGILLIWKNGVSDLFACSDSTRGRLTAFLPAAITRT